MKRLKKRNILMQRINPEEVLVWIYNPGAGGKPKQISYLQRLEAFQEGVDHRPDIGGGRLM